MPEPIRVLIIEDEAPIRRFLFASTEASEAQWHEAEDGASGLRAVARLNPDVVLLDLGLPDMDGLEVLKRLREWSQVPVIVLSARGQERDKVAALDGGADDYLTKPFSTAELLARIRVATRSRPNAPAAPVFTAGSLRVDYGARQVFVDDVEVHLTQIEYRLLCLLTQNAGKLVTQRHLLRKVWGEMHIESTHTLRVHMANLRAKIEVGSQRLIKTETGVGYRFLVQ